VSGPFFRGASPRRENLVRGAANDSNEKRAAMIREILKMAILGFGEWQGR
jgi:hypothetical protein